MIPFLKTILFVLFLILAFQIAFKKDKKAATLDAFPFTLRKQWHWSIIFFIIFLCLLPSVGAIPAGHRGVVLRFGAVTGRILDEGIYMVTPVLEQVKRINVQVRAYETSASSASRDLQEVSTKVTLNYYLVPGSVAKIYQTLSEEYENRIIKPAIQEAVKAATAQFEAEKLITERAVVKESITKLLNDRLSVHNIIVEAVSITDFTFSPEFTKAIEAKVTASQLALKAQRDLERVKMEAQQKIEQAKAEAEALRLQRLLVTKELVDLRKIEVQRLALDKWDGKLPLVVSPGTMPIVDLFDQREGIARNK